MTQNKEQTWQVQPVVVVLVVVSESNFAWAPKFETGRCWGLFCSEARNGRGVCRNYSLLKRNIKTKFGQINDDALHSRTNLDPMPRTTWDGQSEVKVRKSIGCACNKGKENRLIHLLVDQIVPQYVHHLIGGPTEPSSHNCIRLDLDRISRAKTTDSPSGAEVAIYHGEIQTPKSLNGQKTHLALHPQWKTGQRSKVLSENIAKL